MKIFYELVEVLEALEKQPNQKNKQYSLLFQSLFFWQVTKKKNGVMHALPAEVSGKSIASLNIDYLKAFFICLFFQLI